MGVPLTPDGAMRWGSFLLHVVVKTPGARISVESVTVAMKTSVQIGSMAAMLLTPSEPPKSTVEIDSSLSDVAGVDDGLTSPEGPNSLPPDVVAELLTETPQGTPESLAADNSSQANPVVTDPRDLRWCPSKQVGAAAACPNCEGRLQESRASEVNGELVSDGRWVCATCHPIRNRSRRQSPSRLYRLAMTAGDWGKDDRECWSPDDVRRWLDGGEIDSIDGGDSSISSSISSISTIEVAEKPVFRPVWPPVIDPQVLADPVCFNALERAQLVRQEGGL